MPLNPSSITAENRRLTFQIRQQHLLQIVSKFIKLNYLLNTDSNNSFNVEKQQISDVITIISVL